jgi:hypothetical protein
MAKKREEDSLHDDVPMAKNFLANNGVKRGSIVSSYTKISIKPSLNSQMR